MSQSVEESIKKLVANMRINEQDSRRKKKLGESNSKVDEGHEDFKCETHYADVHMDEEDRANIIGREVETFACEVEVGAHKCSRTLL